MKKKKKKKNASGDEEEIFETADTCVRARAWGCKDGEQREKRKEKSSRVEECSRLQEVTLIGMSAV